MRTDIGASALLLSGMLAVYGLAASASSAPAGTSTDRSIPDTRGLAIAQAQIWAPTNIPAMDIMAGPKDAKAFPFRADVHCDYEEKKFAGQSPKFSCRIGPKDAVKVKWGGTNGETYGAVAASRLLWALGFGADHWYPVKVTCRGCPRTLLSVGDAGDRMYGTR